MHKFTAACSRALFRTGYPIRALIATALLATAGCSQPPVNRSADAPLTTVVKVDVERYLGKWYEIARLPNRFEKDCEGVTAEYSLREDGLIKVVNTCRKGSPDGEIKIAEGRARIVDASSNAKLEVSFFGPFFGDYWIIDLADDYSLSIVGEPEGRYLWVLSRMPELSPDELSAVKSKLEQFGYDITKLHYTVQPPVPDNSPAD